MNIMEAQTVYEEFCVALQHAETMGKTRVQAAEEYTRKHGAEKFKAAVEALREQQDKEHETHLEALRIVRMISGRNYEMTWLLNLLVLNINDNIRYCKEHLETEEKTKDVAFLQGKLAGNKELLNRLCGQFGLTQALVEDTGEAMPEIGGYTTSYIKKLWRELQAPRNDDRWASVLESIGAAAENMKNYLLFEADNSRDLYICQSKHEGMTMFETLFANIESEKERREEELAFDGEEGAGNEPVGAAQNEGDTEGGDGDAEE